MSTEPVSPDEIRRFEDQYRRNPDSLVFARLADAHRKAGDPGRALEILEEGISRNDTYPSAHIVRARAYMDLGRPGAAEQSFLRAIDLDASNLVAMRGLASLARERGDEAGARSWFQRISGLEPAVPATPAVPDSLPPPAEAWWTPDEPDAAEEEVTDPSEAWWFEDPVEARSADDGDLLTRTMAELYEKQGLFGEAVAIYRELLEDRPNDADLAAALERAESRQVTAPGAGDQPPVEDAAARESSPAPSSAGSSGRSEVFLEWLQGLRG